MARNTSGPIEEPGMVTGRIPRRGGPPEQPASSRGAGPISGETGSRSGGRGPRPAFACLRWLVLAGLAALLVVVNPLADRAAQYNRDVTIGSTALYGTLRVMNSVMSVAKDADVTGGVGVASVTASPGQLLQPVTNTIDRMADLLFWLAIVSGVLSTLFLPVAKVAAIGLAGVSVLRAGASLSRRALPRAVDRVARAVLTLCLLGAVVLPLSYAVAFHAGARMTDEAWRSATGVFDRINADYDAEAVGQIDALRDSQAPAASPATPDTSFLGRLGSAVDQSQSAISGTVSAASGLVTSLTEGVAAKTKVITDGIAISSDLFTASIAIAVSYLVKILVMPLLILAAALYLMRAAFR
ncbi:hypothetical protein ASG25_11775 [Rhizobium sp. Leaf384]|uniref:hypothetical protein n=1 Tax=unclassified Rhizobium TaxID=2613769 RepID=UPI0007137909|nr:MULTISPECIES: hypothetical protein [unclassified Rhizobium]KQS79235.1 hypothetical protein ASG25_11775 [Rhizobium sp. Leaf384]KQS82803.1 hypothetical protein ASG58_05590 [Rhizobium sp. Leaf383]